MTNTNSKPLLITLAFLLAFFLGVLVFGLYDIQAKGKKTSELLNEADRASETGELAQSIRDIRTGAEENLSSFENFAFSSDQLVPLIEKIEDTGDKLGLETKIASVAKVESKKAEEPTIIRLVVETLGSWAGTSSFLRAIESLPHRVMIDETILSKEGDNWKLRLTFSLHSFD